MAGEQEKPKPGPAATGCATIIVVGIIVWVIVAIAGGSSDSDSSATKYSAFDACTTFVKRQLKSQSTAEFPDPTEDDGEVTFAHHGKVWTILSQVDAENSFGAMLTIPFRCTVRDAGDQWFNVDTTLDERS